MTNLPSQQIDVKSEINKIKESIKKLRNDLLDVYGLVCIIESSQPTAPFCDLHQRRYTEICDGMFECTQCYLDAFKSHCVTCKNYTTVDSRGHCLDCADAYRDNVTGEDYARD